MKNPQPTDLSGNLDASVARLLAWHTLALGETYLLLVSLEPKMGIAAVEAHLIAPRSNEPYRAHRFRYGSSEFLLNEGELSLIDVAEFARQWAEGALESDLLTWVRENAGTTYPDPPKLSPASRSLASLWLAQWQPQILRQIRDRTESQRLRTYLDKLFTIRPVAIQHL